MSTTSIGRGPAHGGNENHQGDPLHTTLGEEVQQEPPAGNEAAGDIEPAPTEKAKQPGTGSKAEPQQ